MSARSLCTSRNHPRPRHRAPKIAIIRCRRARKARAQICPRLAPRLFVSPSRLSRCRPRSRPAVHQRGGLRAASLGPRSSPRFLSESCCSFPFRHSLIFLLDRRNGRVDRPRVRRLKDSTLTGLGRQWDGRPHSTSCLRCIMKLCRLSTSTSATSRSRTPCRGSGCGPPSITRGRICSTLRQSSSCSASMVSTRSLRSQTSAARVSPVPPFPTA